jgi:hypothetical protein
VSGLETAIRNALERSDRSNAEIRARIYQSARHALETGLRKQEVNDPETVAVQRQRLEATIREIEGEERARLHAHEVRPADALPPQTAVDVPVAGVRRTEPALDDGALSVDGETRDDGSFEHPRAAAAMGEFRAERPDTRAPQTVAQRPDDRRTIPAALDIPAERAVRPRRRRGFFSRLFVFAVLVAAVGIGGWWVMTSGVLKSAAQRDTSVPNPPASVASEDFSGTATPQSFDPQARFSDEWVEIFKPEQIAAVKPGSNATVEPVSVVSGPAVRITSRGAGEDGNVTIPVPPAILRELAGKSSTVAITMQSATDKPSQISVQCDFASLGDCARHRFAAPPEKTDALFRVSFERTLAPNAPGLIVLNSDLDGRGQGMYLYSIRVLPGQ